MTLWDMVMMECLVQFCVNKAFIIMNWVNFSLFVISFILTCVFYELAYRKCRGNYKFLIKTTYARIAFVCFCANFAAGMNLWMAYLNGEIKALIIAISISCLFMLSIRLYYTYKIKRRRKRIRQENRNEIKK